MLATFLLQSKVLKRGLYRVEGLGFRILKILHDPKYLIPWE